MKSPAEHSAPKDDRYYAQVNEHILDLLPAGATRFLEAGCGAGALGERVKAERPDAIYHGLELDPGPAGKASERLDRVYATNLDAELPDLEGPYDCVICGDVLEHLVDPWTALRRLVANLSPGGHVVASLPNVRYYKVLRDLVLRGRFTYREKGVLDSTHLRFFTLHEMEQLLASAGLEVTERRARLGGRNLVLRMLDGLTFGGLEELRAVQYTLVGRLPAG